MPLLAIKMPANNGRPRIDGFGMRVPARVRHVSRDVADRGLGRVSRLPKQELPCAGRDLAPFVDRI